MTKLGDYATKSGNLVRYNERTGNWQLLYRPMLFVGGDGSNRGNIRIMGFDMRDDAIATIDKMEADGNA